MPIAFYTREEKVKCRVCQYEDKVEVTTKGDVIVSPSDLIPKIKAKYNSLFLGMLEIKSWKYCPKCKKKSMELK